MLGELVVVATIFLSAPVQSPMPAAGLRFRVIVNRSNAVSSLKRAEVSAIFMKKVRSWPGRLDVLPVDQAATSPLRDQFSRSIHEKSAAYVIRYWQRLIFSGRGIPPSEVATDDAVIEFVRMNRGAIGYVDREMPLPDEVKVITVTK